MTLCPIIHSLRNLFSPNWEQNAILIAGNPVRQPFKNTYKPATRLPFLSYSIQIMVPFAKTVELLSLLIASPQRLLSCGCAKQWLGTRISFVSVSWIQPRLHWGMGGGGGLLSLTVSDLPEEHAQSSGGAQGSKVTAAGLVLWARYQIGPTYSFWRALRSSSPLALAFPIFSSVLQENPQLFSRPNAPTLLQSKFLPLFLCHQYLSGISSTAKDVSSFAGPALAT